MNGSTLRMNSSKIKQRKKKAVKKENISALIHCHCTSQLEIFEKLFSSGSIEEQVQSIKEICLRLSSEDIDIEQEELIGVVDSLVQIFLSVEHSSPLFSPLLKFMSSSTDRLSSVIQTILQNKLKMKLLKEDFSAKHIHNCSLTLLACVEKLPILLEPCISDILTFIHMSLSRSHQDILCESLPVVKLTLITGLHSCIQLSIAICQRWEMSQDIFSLSVKLLSEAELPLDTRSAAGILAAHLSSRKWVKVFDELLISNNELAILSYCSGLLNVFSPDDLNTVIEVNQCKDPPVKVIFTTIISIENRNPTESKIVLASCRCIVLLTRALIKMRQVDVNLIKAILAYLWNHIEHFMDAVRHLALSALTNVQKLAKENPDLGLFEIILNDMRLMAVDRRSKHAAISVLLSEVPVQTIISQSDGLVQSLLSAALATPSSNYALKSLEELMEEDLKENPDGSRWFQRWVVPLLSSQLSSPLEQLFNSIIKIHPPVIEGIVGSELNKSNKNIGVTLTCLKIGRKFGFLNGKDNEEKWKNLVHFTTLESFMCHSNDDVRLSSFGLLVDNSKSSEEFSKKELELIKTFLKYNFSNQEPSIRQKTLALSKKFLRRLRDSRAALIRNLDKASNDNLSQRDQFNSLLSSYTSTIAYIKDLCLDSLFPGGSPARRSFALSFLSLYTQSGFTIDSDQNTIQMLLSCFLDSFEDNKTIAKDLLLSMPMDSLMFNDRGHVNKYLKESIRLSSSIRPQDSISAAYYMALLASFNQTGSLPHLYSSMTYDCISAALEELINEIEVAKESLLQAACSGPLYGHLFVIRYLFQTINLSEAGYFPEWRSLIENIIEVGFVCNSIVCHVVYNSSPEGHLPMDLTYSYVRKDTDPQVTSQMVLLCCWRTVKEVSLLLGELAESATVSDQLLENGLLNKNQILRIGDHLRGLLTETKHRGAFEQAYIGFSKLSTSLWRSRNPQLHDLPNKWLNDTLDLIENNKKLSATRRSAGIPFIVQALICSELESGPCKSLHRAMTALLKIAQHGTSEGRLHALNILRALYRGSTLGEAIGPYIEEGIATAIAGFNSHTWAERNSSTLLLSALISRVFGVPRGKTIGETISWRNRMTGRLFFQRYPSLFGELLGHLERSSEKQLYPALYPVLLLLGRLYPSSLEGTDSNLQLMKYVPYVMACAESSILKTRSLAAMALSSLLTSALHIHYISLLLNKIPELETENHRHGLLLMVLKLAEQASSLEDINKQKLLSCLDSWLETLLNILHSTKLSYVSKDTAIQIVIFLVSEYHEAISQSYLVKIENFILGVLFEKSSKKLELTEYGFEIFNVHSSILLILINFKQCSIKKLLGNIVNLLKSSDNHTLGVILEMIIFLLSNTSSIFSPDIHISLKVKLDNTKFLCQLDENLKNSQALEDIIIEKVCDKGNHHEDMIKILKVLEFFPTAVRKLKKDCSPVQTLYSILKQSSPSVSCLIINSINSLFTSLQSFNSDVGSNDINSICQIIKEFSESDKADECRKATGKLLATNFYYLLKKCSSKEKLELYCGVVRLMLDEDSSVREVVCSQLTPSILPAKGVEIMIEEFVKDEDLETVLVVLIFWAIGPYHPPSETTISSQESLFEKGEKNPYYEEIILNRIAVSHLTTLEEEKSISKTVISQNLSDWLFEKTLIHGCNLTEIISKFGSSVPARHCSQQLLPYSPPESRSFISCYKLEKLTALSQLFL